MSAFIERLPACKAQTVVRILRVTDLDSFHGYRSSAELSRYQGWEPMTIGQALAFLEASSAVEELVPGKWIQLGIAERDTDQLIGDLGVFLSEDGRQGEIGFTLRPESQGRGHATRAVELAMDLIFASSDVEFVEGISDARNTSSLAVLQRAGFTFHRRQRVEFRGERCDEFVFVRRRGEA